MSKSCCTRYLVNPDVPTVAKVVSALSQLPELAPFDVVPNFGTHSSAAPIRELVRSPDLPVPDLVIAHQVFLI